MEVYTLGSVSRQLTEDVIDKYFKVRTNSDDYVKSIMVTRAAPSGEGLLSAVYRVKIKGAKHAASFVAKGLVTDPLLRKTLRSAVYFEREVFFFAKVLPTFVKVQKSTGAKESIQNNVPKCYAYHAGNDEDYILMEDLSDVGCTPISETPTRFELNETLKALAHLHAVSLVLKVKEHAKFSKIMNLLPEVYYNKSNQDWYAKFLSNAIDINKRVLGECENTNSIYYKKFMALVQNVYDQLIDLTSYRGDYPVLCHGDAWLPNFLCSKEKAVAIDFQLFRCTSLVTDLTYVLTLCSNLFSNKQSYMASIGEYYGNLEYYLSDMGVHASEVYPRNVFEDELKRYGKYGVLASLTSFALLNSKRCDVQMIFKDKFVGIDRIPLEELWVLSPIKEHKQKVIITNAVRVAADVGLI